MCVCLCTATGEIVHSRLLSSVGSNRWKVTQTAFFSLCLRRRLNCQYRYRMRYRPINMIRKELGVCIIAHHIDFTATNKKKTIERGDNANQTVARLRVACDLEYIRTSSGQMGNSIVLYSTTSGNSLSYEQLLICWPSHRNASPARPVTSA